MLDYARNTLSFIIGENTRVKIISEKEL